MVPRSHCFSSSFDGGIVYRTRIGGLGDGRLKCRFVGGRRKRCMRVNFNGMIRVFSVRTCRGFIGTGCSNVNDGVGELLVSSVPRAFVRHRLGSDHCVDGIIGDLLSGVMHRGSSGKRCRPRTVSGGMVMYANDIASQLGES